MTRALQHVLLIAILIAVAPRGLTAQEQVTDRIRFSGEIFRTMDERIRWTPPEIHYTLDLLQSEEGRRAVERFAERRDRNLFPRRQILLQYEVGDQETFFVRNPDESEDDDPVFDEVEFELARSAENVEVWVETGELAEDRISQNILDVIMNGLVEETPPNSVDPDRGIIEILDELFGGRPDVDGTGILKILITDIQDGWDPVEQPTFIAGFYDPVNLWPADEHEFSNGADIIYINSTPGIYREGIGFISPRLSTMAHELQHLIHDGFDGFLPVFQNEGQSELSEILTGYSARPMAFLNSRSEVSGNVEGPDGWIYRFRSGEPETVLYDYQRAQLLHSYLEELVGPEAAGSLTYNVNTLDGAYAAVLDPLGIPVPEFFTGFHIANYANNRVAAPGPYGYSRPQFTNVQVDNPGVMYDAEQRRWVVGQVDTLFYGGAHYTQWFGVEDLVLEITGSEGVSQNILYRQQGQTDYQLMEAGEGVFELDEPGLYEEIVLVSVNVAPAEDGPAPGDMRTYTYSGEWTATNLVVEHLSYHGEATGYYPLPEDDLYAFAMRISPDFDSGVQSVRFNVNTRESAVQGQGQLALSLREAVQQGDILRPGPAALASQQISSSDIGAGENFFGVSSTEWEVQAGGEYFVVLEVVEDFGGLTIELLLDGGTTSTTDPAYNPPRTFAGFQENGQHVGWGYFDAPADPDAEDPRFHNNLLMGVNLIGFKEVEDDDDFPDRPISENFELVENYPNPFRDVTTIGLNVPQPAEVEVTVHDVLGRRIQRVFSGEMEVGFHSVEFDAAPLASGIYFYRMNARGANGESFSRIRAMTVIK